MPTKRTRPDLSLNLLARVVEHSPDFVGVSDLAGVPVFANATALEMVGVSWEEMLATPVPDYFIAEERAYVRDVVMPTVAKEGRWTGELNFQHLKTGIVIPVLYDVFRVDDPVTGEPTHLATIARDLRKQRESEAALGASQELIRLILSNMTDGVKILDLDANLLEMNRAARALHGITDLKPFLGNSYLEFWRVEDREGVMAALNKAKAGGVGRCAGYVPTTGGNDRWRNVVITPIMGYDNKPEKLLCISHDLTEELRSHSELADARRRLDAAISGGQMATWVWDIPTDEFHGDKNTTAFFNLKTGTDLIPLNSFLDTVHVDDREEVVSLLSRSLETGEDYVSEYRISTFDPPRWTYARGRVEYDEDRKPVRVSGIVQDISERKRSEADRDHLIAQLKQSELHFRQLADTIPQLAWMARPDGWIFWYNRRWYEYTGMTPEQMEGWGWQAVHDPNELESVMTRWVASIESGEPFDMTFPLRGADGEFRPFLTRTMPFRDEHGAIQLWFGTNTDVSAQRKMSLEREELLRREREARSVAENASRMKDEFLATLSHELRTPLNAIFGWTQLLMSGKDDPELVSEAVDVIDRNVRVQVRLIEDLLDMSRIVSGKLRLAIQPISANEFIEAAIETVAPAAAAKEITLVRALDPIEQRISGDAGRLQQVIWNLLSNAIKFTPRGGRVGIALRAVSTHVEIAISDSGKGISEEFLPHVFDRFRQADASTTREHGGLGIGLAIVKQLVELHGGTVHVHSDGPDLGTTFVVLLPTKLAAVPELEELVGKKDSRFHREEGIQHDLSGLRILVVDDEPDACRLLERILRTHDADVISASSGAEALLMIASNKPDVLVSDIGMAEMDGFELISKIRSMSISEGGQIPALALTAFARSEDRSRALHAGFLAHLAKPVEASELVKAIASLVGRS